MQGLIRLHALAVDLQCDPLAGAVRGVEVEEARQLGSVSAASCVCGHCGRSGSRRRFPSPATAFPLCPLHFLSNSLRSFDSLRRSMSRCPVSNPPHVAH